MIGADLALLKWRQVNAVRTTGEEAGKVRLSKVQRQL
jgi:hypothetical protein